MSEEWRKLHRHEDRLERLEEVVSAMTRTMVAHLGVPESGQMAQDFQTIREFVEPPTEEPLP